MFRFGFMSLVVWLTSKFTKSGGVSIYWVGILVTTATVAVAHLSSHFSSCQRSLDRLNDLLPDRPSLFSLTPFG